MKKRKLAAISLISMFTFLGVKTDKEAQAKIKATEKRTEFVHNLNSWQKLLFTEIEKYDNWDKYETFKIGRYTIRQESTDSPTEVEKRKRDGKEISFGLAQIAFCLYEDYITMNLKQNPAWFKKLNHDQKKQLLFKIENNIPCFVWNMNRYYTIKPDWKYVLTMHCMGPGEYKKSEYVKLGYYPEFVNRVRKRMPREIRGML
jgi:hypothetical protein